MTRFVALSLALVAFVALLSAPRAQSASSSAGACPPDMVRVRQFCIDRFEMGTVDHATGEPLSPFYPPHQRLAESIVLIWTTERGQVGDPIARQMPLPELSPIQRLGKRYAPRAVSRPGVVPQGYLSQPLARTACENAGKRLCTESEWITACRGEANRKYPYGDRYDATRCNVYRHFHPATVLHGAAWYGHRDPRLNLVQDSEGSPLLRLTGAMSGCATVWGADRVYDMVGNLDEWVDDEKGAFLGGFYARSTREGCEARVGSHPPAYYDYSTGARCCKDG